MTARKFPRTEEQLAARRERRRVKKAKAEADLAQRVASNGAARRSKEEKRLVVEAKRAKEVAFRERCAGQEERAAAAGKERKERVEPTARYVYLAAGGTLEGFATRWDALWEQHASTQVSVHLCRTDNEETR